MYLKISVNTLDHVTNTFNSITMKLFIFFRRFNSHYRIKFLFAVIGIGNSDNEHFLCIFYCNLNLFILHFFARFHCIVKKICQDSRKHIGRNIQIFWNFDIHFSFNPKAVCLLQFIAENTVNDKIVRSLKLRLEKFPFLHFI